MNFWKASKELNYAVEKLSEKIKQQFPNLPNVTWVALRLLEGDQSVIDAVKSGELGNLREQSHAIDESELKFA
jgi:ferrous iron transport protein B